MNNLTIQGLWVGDRLSTMERLVISSYIANGHRFHLYVYKDLEGIPEGTEILDGNAVLPERDIFFYSRGDVQGSFAGFANFFRYKLLLEKGGWWTDMDMVCLLSFDFDEPYVFSSEREDGRDAPNVGIIKVPPGSRLMQYCWDFCRAQDKTKLRWGMTGPDLFEQAVMVHSLHRYVRPVHEFCSIPYDAVDKLLEPGGWQYLPEKIYGLHLWHEMWRQQQINKDATFSGSSIYELLKQRYLAAGDHDIHA